LHPRRKSVIELEGADNEDGGESAANEFAKRTLLQGRLPELVGADSLDKVKDFAKSVGVGPGLAAAIRAYDLDQDAWRLASKVRRRLDDSSLR
jgi:hypothetical protein